MSTFVVVGFGVIQNLTFSVKLNNQVILYSHNPDNFLLFCKLPSDARNQYQRARNCMFWFPAKTKSRNLSCKMRRGFQNHSTFANSTFWSDFPLVWEADPNIWVRWSNIPEILRRLRERSQAWRIEIPLNQFRVSFNRDCPSLEKKVSEETFGCLRKKNNCENRKET